MSKYEVFTCLKSFPLKLKVSLRRPKNLLEITTTIDIQ